MVKRIAEESELSLCGETFLVDRIKEVDAGFGVDVKRNTEVESKLEKKNRKKISRNCPSDLILSPI